MSDARERLLAWFAEGRLLRPDPAEPNAVDLVRALASCSGVDLAAAGLDSPGARRLAARIGAPAHLLFVLVDGLGTALLERLDPAGPLRAAQVEVLRSVFPSATASAITSLATGAWPAQHAVPGWWTRLPEHGRTVVALPFTDRDDGRPLEEHGLTTAVFPLPPLLARYTRDALVIQPRAIADSTYSRYFRGPVGCVGYDGLADAVDAALERLERAPAPSYTYLYLPSVDKLAHERGPDAPETQAHVRELEGELARLFAAVRAKDARLVLSADHGLIAVPPERRHVLRGDDAELTRDLDAFPAGEPRVPQFHLPAPARERFAAAFAERFGEAFALLPVEDAEALELFGPGPLTPAARARIGAFLAISPGLDVLLPRPPGRDEPTGLERMVGFHGGLLPDEVRIPLVVV